MKRKRFLATLLALAVALPQAAALAVRAEGEPGPAPGENYIVKLCPDAVTLFSAEEQGNYLGFDMYLVSQAEAQELMAAGLVEFAEPDGDVELCGVPTDDKYANQWHLQGNYGLDLNSLWQNGMSYTGKGIKIGIVDSGVNLDHEDLDYYSANNPNGRILPGINLYYNTDETGAAVGDIQKGNDPTDELGHGTMVTGIISAAHNGKGVAGIAPGAAILPIKSFVGRTTKVSLLVRGIKEATEAGCDVINLSCGTKTDNASKPMDAATQAAVDQGILVISAVGNNYDTLGRQLLYPAAYDRWWGWGPPPRAASGPPTPRSTRACGSPPRAAPSGA